MTQTERRKKFIIDILYFVILLAILVLILQYAFYPLLPIFISIIVAVILQRPVRFLNKRFKIPRGLVATVLVLAFLALIVWGVYALGARAVTEVQNFITYVQKYVTDYDWIHSQVYNVVNSLPKVLYDNVIDTVDELMQQLEIAMGNDAAAGDQEISFAALDLSAITSKVGSGVSAGVSGVLATAKQIPSILVAIIIGIILSIFMTIEYDDILIIIAKILGEENNKKFAAARRVMGQSVGKLAKAYLVICGLTFAELTIGLTVLKGMGIYKGQYIMVIALITAILDILPVLGIGTVMWPWMAICLVGGDMKMLVGLLIIYAVITVIRHIVEPKLVSNTMELPAALTLSVMYVGLKFFGVLGMFVFIIVLYCVVALNKEGIIHITHEENKEIAE